MDAARKTDSAHEPARKAAPLPLWHKAGTIERILRNTETIDGDRWPYAEKLVAVHLLTYAVTTHAAPRCTVGLAKLADQLGMTRKTFANHVAGLAKRGLIEYARDRDRGGMTFYLGALVRRFAEGGTGLTGGSISAIGKRQMGKFDATDVDDVVQMGKNDPSAADDPQMGRSDATARIQTGDFRRPDEQILPAADGSNLPVSLIDLVTVSRNDVVDRLTTAMIDAAQRHPLHRPKAITHAAKWRAAWRAPLDALLTAGYDADELLAMIAVAEQRLADYPNAEWGVEFVTSARTWAAAQPSSRNRGRHHTASPQVDDDEPDWDAIGRGELIKDPYGPGFIPNPARAARVALPAE